MAIPAYLWLKDDGGAAIKGSVEVINRQGSIEIKSFGHSLTLPADDFTGRLTAARIHGPIMFEKQFDAATPYLYRAVATGQRLKSAEIRWYRINSAGFEELYFIMLMEGVRIVAVVPAMTWKEGSGHIAHVSLRYEKITWKYCDGNVQFSDSWNDRILV